MVQRGVWMAKGSLDAPLLTYGYAIFLRKREIMVWVLVLEKVGCCGWRVG